MKKIQIITTIFLVFTICFLIVRNIQIDKENKDIYDSYNRNLAILDSMINNKYNSLKNGDELERFNKYAIEIINTGNEIVEDYNKKMFSTNYNTKYESFHKIAKYHVKENFFSYNENYTPLDIKLLQLWYLEKMNNYITPSYQFDAYRILAVEEELKQSQKPHELRLWFEYVSLCHDDKEYVKIIYNNDTILKKDFYFKINYTPIEKGAQYIPVKVLYPYQNEMRDYNIYLNVK